MPSRQLHRGQHPEDGRLFAECWLPALREGARDLAYLYTRHYAEKAAGTLVGDHYQLDCRQRMALQRAVCSDQSLARRRAHCVPLGAVAGESLALDGYNLLITIESALAGGVLIQARDGCLRDLASIHGSYRRVLETLPALQRIGDAIARLAPGRVQWWLDAPVSNSGRLKRLIEEEAVRHDWPWDVRLELHPDKPLAESPAIVVTSDSWILDRVGRWANLAPYILEGCAPAPLVLRLDNDCGGA